MKLGDAISTVATPIARLLNLDCIDQDTNDLKPESPCAQRRTMLNNGRYADVVFDFFWSKKKEMKGELVMLYTVTKQIQVEAESPEEAVQKCNEGKTITITAAPRAVTQKQPATITGHQPQAKP